MHHFIESHGRSILKAITWKIVATIISFSVSYYQTGDFSHALKFSLVVLGIGLIAYYLHERTWNSIHWGKQRIEERT